jgi:hypothetical protein
MRSILVVLACAGCGIADFDLDQPIPEQHVQGSGIPGPLAALFPIPIQLDLSARIKEQTTGPIDSVTLSSLTLSISATDRPSGDTDDWGFVDEIRVFVKSSKSGSSLPRTEIAHIVAPGAVQKLVFEIEDDVDLKPYVEEGSVVESEGKGTIPSDDVSYDGLAVFTVHPL